MSVSEPLPDLLAHGVIVDRRLSPAGTGGELYRGRAKRGGREIACMIRVRRRSGGYNDAECIGLEHPNIVRTIAAGPISNGDGSFVVSEAHAGLTLTQLLAQTGPASELWLPAPVVLHISLSVLEAFEYAHTRTPRFLFSGCPPGRTLVGSDGRVRLLPNRCAGSLAEGLAYSAPEMLRGMALTARSDLFGLGVVCYELLSGQHPILVPADLAAHKHNTLPMFRILTERKARPLPPRLRAESLAAMLADTLALRPEDRPGSASLWRDRFVESWPFTESRRDGCAQLAVLVTAAIRERSRRGFVERERESFGGEI